MSVAGVHYMKQGDTTPTLVVQLIDVNGGAVDLTTATSVTFRMAAVAHVPIIEKPATVTTPALGIVEYEWDAGDTDTGGNFDAEFSVIFPGGRVETFPSGEEYIPIVIGSRLT